MQVQEKSVWWLGCRGWGWSAVRHVAAKLAHAMNGQLFGRPVPQPGQRNTYHLMRNAMLAAGLHSNWWLNPTGMNPIWPAE